MTHPPEPKAGDAPAYDWSAHEPDLFAQLGSSTRGLSEAEARLRLQRHGPNRLAKAPRSDALTLLLRQFASPILVILLAAAFLSFLLDSPTDGLIIVVIVAVSGLLGFWQERRAHAASGRLLALVELRCQVRRDGTTRTIPPQELVPGDIVLLDAGAGIPADCRLLDEQDLCVDEAAITGESFPVEKQPGALPPDTPLAARANLLHLGSHVVSGSGTAVVLHTGRATTLGSIAERLRQAPGETSFERGVRRFGNLLLELTLLLIALIFAVNVFLQRPVADSFLFALALGVGLTPQLLPAVLTVNLARGAQAMARRQVIVKRLAAIEDFGSMEVLCADKTGTLTEGRPRLREALAADGAPAERVLAMARLNAAFESSSANPIDDALRALGPVPCGWRKCDEKPFDFHRKRQSLLLTAPDGSTMLITKGAVQTVLPICEQAECADGRQLPLAALQAALLEEVEKRSARGERLLAVACRPHPEARLEPHSEAGMTLLGLVALEDPLKPGIAATVRQLRELGVRLKMISGDSAAVARHVAGEAGLEAQRLITGAEMLRLRDEALPVLVQQCDVFAEVEPNQKERLIRALRRSGQGVGYLGDGINDAPAMHAADVSLSVQGAVDVATEAADIVLLEKDLGVLIEGIREGRRSFANTLKYVFMATSANVGNMLSMALASLLLPFLPLLPKQILLLPTSPLGPLFGFVALPPHFYGWLALILLAYGLTAEAAKARFYRRNGGSAGLSNHKRTG